MNPETGCSEFADELVSSGPPSPALAGHLTACAACRETREAAIAARAVGSTVPAAEVDRLTARVLASLRPPLAASTVTPAPAASASPAFGTPATAASEPVGGPGAPSPQAGRLPVPAPAAGSPSVAAVPSSLSILLKNLVAGLVVGLVVAGLVWWVFQPAPSHLLPTGPEAGRPVAAVASGGAPLSLTASGPRLVIPSPDQE